MKPSKNQVDCIVTTFGRFNPPTVGHLKLINHIKKLSEDTNSDHLIFVSDTHDCKRNPLSRNHKLTFMKQMFPGTNIHEKSDVTHVLGMMEHIEKLGYRKVIVVVGEDRLENINNVLHKYNGKEYDFDHISVVACGERDSSSSGVKGISGSKMRVYALKNNFKGFCKGVPQKKYAREMFNAVRKNMINN
jgi:nicotinic acid mononucleotide adenylyltransferase